MALLGGGKAKQSGAQFLAVIGFREWGRWCWWRHHNYRAALADDDCHHALAVGEMLIR
jgi:hypothetical protein